MRPTNLTATELAQLNEKLYSASYNGNVAEIKTLIERKANVDLPNKNGTTPLLVASQQGHSEAIKALIAGGAKVDLADKDGWTPLFVASLQGHSEAIKTLIERKATVDLPNKNGATPLYVASENGHTEAIKALIERGATVDKAKNDGATPLFIASKKGHSEAIKTLIELGAKVDLAKENGATPLLVASENGHTEAIKLLIEKGANVDLAMSYGWTPLYVASYKGHTEAIKTLIELGAKVDLAMSDGATPLYIASQNGHSEAIKALIERGATVDLPNKDGFTPLYVASEYGHSEAIKLLLAYGADLNQTPTSGNFKDLTALQFAVLSKYSSKDLAKQKQIIQTLFDYGADISVLNDKFFAKYPYQLDRDGDVAKYDSGPNKGQKIPVSLEIKQFIASLNNQQSIAKRNRELIALNKERDANIARIKQQLIDQSATKTLTSQDLLALAGDVADVRSKLTELTTNQEEIFKQHQNQSEALQQAINQQLQSSISTDQINPKFTLSKDDLTEIKYLQQDPELYQYYQRMQKCFNEAFLFANIVSQGGATIEETSKIVKYLESSKELAGDIPFASLIIGQIKSVASEVSKAKTKGKQANFSDIIFTADSITSSLLAEKIARRFAITRELNSQTPNQIIANKDQILPQNQSRITKIKEYLKEKARKFLKKVDKDIERGFLGEELNNSQQLAILDFEKSAQFIFDQGISDDIKSLPDEDPQKSNKIAEEIVSKSLELELQYYQDQSQGQLQSQSQIQNQGQSQLQSQTQLQIQIQPQSQSQAQVQTQDPIISNTSSSSNQANQTINQINQPTNQSSSQLPSLASNLATLMQQQFEQFRKQQEQENERKLEQFRKELQEKNDRKIAELEKKQKEENERKELENQARLAQLQEENDRREQENQRKIAELKETLEKNRDQIKRIFEEFAKTSSTTEKLKKLAKIADFAPNLDITIGEGNQARTMKLGDIMKSQGNSTQSQIQILEQNTGSVFNQISAQLEQYGVRIDQIENSPSNVTTPRNKSTCCIAVMQDKCNVM